LVRIVVGFRLLWRKVVVFDWCGGSTWIRRFGGFGVAVVSCFAGVAVVAESLGVVRVAERFGVVEVLAGGTRRSVLLVRVFQVGITKTRLVLFAGFFL
jgi:hypothetical protein